ncbi:hypothetical protein BJ912DRAFT_933472 [Pholiota molesta]|nr:hypothetical protein BJ912DRAFT_933472 [Pholiota molesta]
MVKVEKERGDAYQWKLWNKTREAKQAKDTQNILQKENARIKLNLHLRGFRAPKQKENLIKKTMKKCNNLSEEIYIKEKGVVKDPCCVMIRELGAMNILEEKTDKVIKTVAKALGMEITNTVSVHTVGRIMKEGGIAA